MYNRIAVTNYPLPMSFEQIASKRLGEEVCWVRRAWDVRDREGLCIHMMTKKMISNFEVLHAPMIHRVLCDLDAGLIVYFQLWRY